MANHDDQDGRDGDAAGMPESRGGGIYVSGGNYGAVAQGHQARAVSVSAPAMSRALWSRRSMSLSA